MFENQQPSSAPMNPVVPPATPPPGPTNFPPASMPPSPAMTPQPQVHTMPERFRTTGSGPQRSGSTKKLMIILIVILVVGALGVAAMYLFQNYLTQETNTNTTTNIVVNENSNENTNSSLNDNANTNVTTNDNSNTNVGLNTNAANTNASANTNAATNANTNTSTTATPLPSSTDTDADGLTDTEEAVYGTDASKPDTDGDTFIDGKQVRSDGSIVGEVYLGFNPKGTGQLEGSTIVVRQENGSKSFSLLVPAGWTVTNDSADGLLVSPSQQTGEFFQVRTNDNASRLTPKQWYQTNNPTSQVDTLTTLAVNGLEGLLSEDGSTVYLFKDAKVYSIQYSTGALSQVNYRTTFDMMSRSFKLVAS